ncbi:MAG: hypothetical protein AAF152_15105 [Cyanobacteria bacterium P01_A01_bin.114]
MLPRLLKLTLASCLILCLSACQVLAKVPPQGIVEVAIATQLAQTQQALVEQLAPSTPHTPNFKLSQIKVDGREALPEGDNPRYRVRGTYQATIKLPGRQVKDSSVFEIYVEQEPAVSKDSPEQWYLIWPQTGERILLTSGT